MEFKLYLNTLKDKGNLAYEYNPFHNYQTDVDLYLVDSKYLVPTGLAVNIRNGQLLTSVTIDDQEVWVDKYNNIISSEDLVEAESGDFYAAAGSLIDLDTEKLNFDLEHPVDIEVLPSYDGSVNLILNDDKNIPRLINSRFSVREKNTFEVVDRFGENDTNIYNSKTFDKDTSLYFQYEYNPVVNYLGFINGSLPVGSYCFYFTYCDADNNESDYIAESGLIPVFIGSDKDPNSMDGGIKNQNSNKGIKLKLTNVDKAYNYIKVYYVRYLADYQQSRVPECKKIYLKYPINNSNILYLQITGNEEAEDIDANILNITRFNPKSVLTLAQCKNMLFFGNIVKNVDNYKELTDCALRIVPQLEVQTFNQISNTYQRGDSDWAYYNSLNIYNKVGYFDLEFYRFGIVFIYLNGTLSNVYNTLGCTLKVSDMTTPDTKAVTYKGSLYEENYEQDVLLKRKYIVVDDFGWIKNSSDFFENGENLNARGVCHINANIASDNQIVGIKFQIPEEVSKFLKDIGIRGYFFVRLKRIPDLLALCYLLPMDEVLEAPVIEYGKDRHRYEDEGENEDEGVKVTECFVTQGREISNQYRKVTVGEETVKRKIKTGDRLLINSYKDHLYTYKNEGHNSGISKNAYAAICPDFLLNLPYYNLIFNGAKFKIQKVADSTLVQNNRIYVLNKTTYSNANSKILVSICTVTESVPTVALEDKVYKLNIGQAEEAFRFKYAEIDSGTYNSGEEDYTAVNEATNIVRGIYSPYLAIYSQNPLDTSALYNIYQDETTSEEQKYQNRMDSSEPYYSICDRYNFDNSPKNLICWRGDCFINTFTYRVNRNFNDSSLPNNDEIIDPNSWRNNYDITAPNKWKNISKSDVNAVLLGSWISFKIRSYMNYALRSEDHSYVSEEALMGTPRTYYPRNKLMYRGANKLPDSYLFNDAYRASLGFKCYFTLKDLNYLKDTFSNRIQYSAISIQDSYKNNYRFSLSTYFRDYSQEYGSIIKLVEYAGHLLVVFEHAIGIALINERVLANSGDGEPVFINTNNVLPEQLTMITDTYGSQWPESIVKSEEGYVYGVDTVNKKIWRVKGESIELISDFKVNKFLVDNITLGERELLPYIGLKNVKTHYNNNKKDIMFTFYDDTHKDEEKAWNLCFNELLNLFTTFYSWIPSYSENIDTQFFTFNRDTSKRLSLLLKCNYNIKGNSGILADSPILKLKYLMQAVSEVAAGSRYIVASEMDKYWYIFFPELEPIKVEDITLLSNNLYDKYAVYLFPNTNIMRSLDNRIVDWHDEGGVFKFHWTTDSPSGGVGYNYVESESVNYWRFYAYGPGANVELQSDGTYSASFSYDAAHLHIFKKDETLDEILYSKLYYSNGEELLNDVSFEIEKDHWLNDKLFKLNSNNELIGNREAVLNALQTLKVLLLTISARLNGVLLGTETIALTAEEIINNNGIDGTFDPTYPKLTTDFYLHGQSGIIDIKGNNYPTYWYDEQHPFEFEFVVNEDIGSQKIFNNLVLISNKAEPESFHFEIEGDNYDFSSDKRAMYYRLERTKEFYQSMGSDMLFNRNYKDVKSDKLTLEQYYRNSTPLEYPVERSGLYRLPKSTIFPLYYERVDTYNDIYDKYWEMKSDGNYDFKNLTGSEIVWNRDLNQFNIATHIKNSPINHYGRLRGNSYYKEGLWNIQIPTIFYSLKKEDLWELEGEDEVPPIVINSLYSPADVSAEALKNLSVTEEGILNFEDTSGKKFNYTTSSGWSARKEARLRDKWIKIRIRYSGKNLAIIHSIATLYNISYS